MAGLDGSTQTDPETIQEDLQAGAAKQGVARARTVIAPETVGELVDPILLDDQSFFRDLLQRGHDSDFFSYQHGGSKRPRVAAESLSIEESDAEASGRSRAHFTITSHGRLILERRIRDDEERGHRDSLSYMFELPVSELAKALDEVLSFASDVIALIDPGDRHPRWIYNAALASIGSRRIVEQRSHGTSYSMPIGREDFIIAFDRPRLITRAALRDERGREVERMVAMLRRRQE